MYFKELAATEKNNVQNYIKFDSLRNMELKLTRDEMKDYINHNSQLIERLENLNIKPKQVERIITNTIEYRDTSSNEINLEPILNAIKQNKSLKFPFQDKTECLTVSGFVSFDNDTLKTVIDNRVYTDTIYIVRSWKRKKVLGIGIGKKQFKTDILNNCGDVKVKVIEKKK
jgi:predicted RND superfamily exporter protein